MTQLGRGCQTSDSWFQIPHFSPCAHLPTSYYGENARLPKPKWQKEEERLGWISRASEAKGWSGTNSFIHLLSIHLFTSVIWKAFVAGPWAAGHGAPGHVAGRDDRAWELVPDWGQGEGRVRAARVELSVQSLARREQSSFWKLQQPCQAVFTFHYRTTCARLTQSCCLTFIRCHSYAYLQCECAPQAVSKMNKLPLVRWWWNSPLVPYEIWKLRFSVLANFCPRVFPFENE